MVKEIRIRTIDEARKELFFHQDYREDIGRNRNQFVYRGIPDVNFTLTTSLERFCKGKKEELEELVLNNFAKYAELECPTINESVWRKMILGQHHGLPTRLLDWSRSPLMALHFAMTESDMDRMDQRDCALWRLDITRMNEMLPGKYRNKLTQSRQKVFSVDMLQSVCESLSEYDADMGSSCMVMMEPPTIDLRIANQYSYFSVVPAAITKVETLLEKCPDGVVKYVIDKNIRWEIRDMLDQANINERVVYPGLDGIATWLSRFYFVRDLNRLSIQAMSVADLEADVIINPSNCQLLPYEGVNAAIFEKAGKEALTAACRSVTQAAPVQQGDVAVTGAFGLKADWIFHAVSGCWNSRQPEDSGQKLAALYRKILDMTKARDLHSVGFPLLSAGSLGCPEEKAWEIGLRSCLEFQRQHSGYAMNITFCVIETARQKTGERILAGLRETMKSERKES